MAGRRKVSSRSRNSVFVSGPTKTKQTTPPTEALVKWFARELFARMSCQQIKRKTPQGLRRFRASALAGVVDQLKQPNGADGRQIRSPKGIVPHF
jgi:hypothetical protein